MARRLERVREKFGFSSIYEILQTLLSAFLRYSDPGGEPYAALDQSVVHLAHIFEGLENDLTRSALCRPGHFAELRLESILAIYHVSGKQKRSVRAYHVKSDGTVTSSVNEGDALMRLLCAVSPAAHRLARKAMRSNGFSSLVELLSKLPEQEGILGEIRDEFSEFSQAELPRYGERARRVKSKSMNDEA